MGSIVKVKGNKKVMYWFSFDTQPKKRRQSEVMLSMLSMQMDGRLGAGTSCRRVFGAFIRMIDCTNEIRRSITASILIT